MVCKVNSIREAKVSIKKILFAVFAVLLLAQSASAEVRKGWYVSPFVGGYMFEGNQGIEENSPTVGAGVGYMFSKHCGLEGAFGYIPTHSENDALKNLGKADINISGYLYKIDGIYHFNPLGKISPYVAAGFGGISIDPESGKGSHTKGLFDWGGGVEYFVSDRLALRGDVRHLITAGASNLMYTAGLTWYFGAPAAPAAAPPKVEPPAPPAPPAPPVSAPEPPKVEPTPPPAPVPAPETPTAEPTPPAAPAQIEQNKVIEIGKPRPEDVMCINIRIEFDFDKSFIRPIYHDDLKKVADCLKQLPDNKATLEGYTDWTGGEKYNLKLSERRADAVKKYLVEKFGVDGAKLTTKGYGKTHFVESNKTKEGRQKNRRTELHILKNEMPK